MSQKVAILPPISNPRYNSGQEYDVIEQDYNAISVESPRRRKVYMESSTMSPRINSLEDKVSQALSTQSQVLAQQQQVTDTLNQQQLMTKNMIEHAFQNRDDFIENLSRGTDDRIEAKTRYLLQNHLRYITAIVQRLNHDIDVSMQILFLAPGTYTCMKIRKKGKTHLFCKYCIKTP